MFTALPPLGLMNLGLSCWWNSVLQMILHNPYIRECIEMKTHNLQNAPLHYHIQQLIACIRQRDPYETYNWHVRLYKSVLQLHPVFRESNMNDAHEVLTYMINQLHDESCVKVPEDTLPSDSVGRAIIRDFNGTLSRIIHNVACCTKRTNSDNEVLIESYVTLFLEPKEMQPGLYSIEEALKDIRFGFLPRCLYLSLIVGERANCRIKSSIMVQGFQYKLHSMVFFIPSASHYVSAVLTDFVDHKPLENQDWMFCNDNHISMINFSQMRDYIGSDGYPTILSYVQVDENTA